MDISSTFCLDRKIKIKIRKGKGHLMVEKKSAEKPIYRYLVLLLFKDQLQIYFYVSFFSFISYFSIDFWGFAMPV